MRTQFIVHSILVYEEIQPENTALYTFSINRWWRNYSNGSALTVAQTLFFTIHIYLSISGTCSSIPVMFSVIPSASNAF